MHSSSNVQPSVEPGVHESFENLVEAFTESSWRSPGGRRGPAGTSRGPDQLAESFNRRVEELEAQIKVLRVVSQPASLNAAQTSSDNAGSGQIVEEFRIIMKRNCENWAVYTRVLLANLLGTCQKCIFSNGNLFLLRYPVTALVLYAPLAYVGTFLPSHEAFRGPSSRSLKVACFVCAGQGIGSIMSLVSLVSLVEGVLSSPHPDTRDFRLSKKILVGSVLLIAAGHVMIGITVVKDLISLCRLHEKMTDTLWKKATRSRVG